MIKHLTVLFLSLLVVSACSRSPKMPYTVCVDSRLGIVKTVAALEAAQAWNDAFTSKSSKPFNIVRGTFPGSCAEGNAREGWVDVSASEKFDGLPKSATGYTDEGSIVIFSKEIDEAYSAIDVLGDDAVHRITKQTVMRLLGHILGLPNSNDQHNVMGLNDPKIVRLPNADDVALVCRLNAC